MSLIDIRLKKMCDEAILENGGTSAPEKDVW